MANESYLKSIHFARDFKMAVFQLKLETFIAVVCRNLFRCRFLLLIYLVYDVFLLKMYF